jgi:type III secretory pathway component EscS
VPWPVGIAVIAGLVVGLFNNFTQGISLSPLAVAFLVGYGVEIFFSFLDTFLGTLRKGGSRELPQRA